ncbi:MAG: hypothetical protein ACTSXD_11755 [Candidatus Heimdallarchaeaceae archaeon]
MDEEIQFIQQKPNFVRCTICGKDKYTNPEVMKKRIEKFGSEEEMRKKYVCRECRKKIKERIK